MRNERSCCSEEDRHRLVYHPDLDRVSGEHRLWGGDDQASDRLREVVRHAVDTVLTSKQREVVEAYFFEGLSQQQIADRLGISQQVVQKRLYGARRRDHVVGGAIQRLRGALANLHA